MKKFAWGYFLLSTIILASSIVKHVDGKQQQQKQKQKQKPLACSSNVDCESFLTSDEAFSPAVSGTCYTVNAVTGCKATDPNCPSICAITYYNVDKISSFEKARNPSKDNCVADTGNEKDKKLCAQAVKDSEIAEPRFAWSSYSTPVYICTNPKTKKRYTTCPIQAMKNSKTEENAAQDPTRKKLPKPYCNKGATCKALLSTSDQSNQDIYKLCYRSDPADPTCNSKNENCEHVCVFIYFKGGYVSVNADQTARNPNPTICEAETSSEAANAACQFILKDLQSEVKGYTFTSPVPAVYRCKKDGKSYFACPIQGTA